MSKLEVDAIEPQSGTTLTIGASGDSVNIASGASITDFTSTGIDDNATSTAITINSSENVGIGTTSPASILDVRNSDSTTDIRIQNEGTGVAKLRLLSGGTSSSSIIDFGDDDDGNTGAIIYSHSSDHMVFSTNTAESMRINSNGSILYAQGNYAYTERVDNLLVSSGGTVTLFDLWNGNEGRGHYLVSVTRVSGSVATRALGIVASSSSSLSIAYSVLDSNQITIGTSGSDVTATYTGGSTIEIRATAVPLVIEGN